MECLLDAGHSGELRLESIKFSAAKLGWQLNAVWLFNKEHLAGFLQWLISDRFKPTDDCWVNSFFNVFCFMKASRPLGYGDEKKTSRYLVAYGHTACSNVLNFHWWLLEDARSEHHFLRLKTQPDRPCSKPPPAIPTHHDVFGETRRGG